MDKISSHKSGRSSIQPQRLTNYAAWSITFTALSGTWPFGYGIGSINAAYEPITCAIKEHYEHRSGVNISSSALNIIWAVNSAAFPFGGIMGSFLVGSIAKRFGRRKSMLYGHCAVVILSLLAGLSDVIMSPEAIILSRIGQGITASAMGTGVTTMYVAELSPKHLRGVFGSMIGIGIVVGIEGANILGLKEIFGNKTLWPVLLAMAGAPSLVFIILYKFLPDSPRELYIEKDKEENATILLKNIRGTNDVESEIDDMRREKGGSTTKQKTLVKLIRSHTDRKSVVALAVLSLSYQLTGIDAISFNMNKILNLAGIENTLVAYYSVGINGMVVVIHLIFVSINTAYLSMQKCDTAYSALSPANSQAKSFDRLGRKQLLILGYGIETLSLLLLIIAMETMNLANDMKYISAAATLGYVVGYSVGPGPITFLQVSEIFDQFSRPAAMTLANALMWMMCTIIVAITPYFLNEFGGYIFVPYAIIAFLTLVYVYKYLPETKNKTFSEIQKTFRKSSANRASSVNEMDIKC